MTDNYYIYCFLDPRKPGSFTYSTFSCDFEPFYLGKGKDQRWKRHFCPSVQNSPRENKHKKHKIEKIIRETGSRPIVIKVIENLTEESSHELETQLIKEIGRLDLYSGPLVNLTDGGEGMSGNVPSDETKRKLSASAKLRRASDETKRQMSMSRKGRRHSLETLAEIKNKFRDPNKPPKYHVKDLTTGEDFHLPNLTAFCESRNINRLGLSGSIRRSNVYLNRFIAKKL